MKKAEFLKVDLRLAKREKARKIGRAIPKTPSELPQPSLSQNASYIAKTRYAFRNERGEPVESPKDMFWRVAFYIAAADTIYSHRSPRGEAGRNHKSHLNTAREFYKIMASQNFIPNTPTLVNSAKIGQSLSACFVLPVEDDMRSILKSMSDMAMIHKMAGGTGFSFSRLRPKDDIIDSSKGKSTGPVAFMQAYNDVCSQIRQGGVRRGANMGILHYTHPDILRFAVHKIDEFSLTNFNISITVTEQFMEKVKEDAKFASEEVDFDPAIDEIKEAYTIRDLDLKNVRIEEGVLKLYELCRATHEGEGYDLINPRNGKVMDRLNAKRVFDLVTKLAWQYGDPGLILIDRINNSRANPVPQIGPIEATNPCAEQPLHAYDACTLGSVNLAKFVIDTKKERVEDLEKRIDWEAMKKVIHSAVHFLDNVLDMNEYPVEEIDKMTSAIRRIGLGVMGWADLLVKLGVGYDTQEGFDLARKVMKFVQKEADNASCNLAAARGVFPAFKGSIYDKKDEIRPRNGARTTIAPTGTISLLADCSSGIEPHFALTYAKNTIEGKRLLNTNPYLVENLKEKGIYSEELLSKIEENHGSIQSLEEIPQDLIKTFVAAGDIKPADHIRMEAAFQEYTDNGISKTINFPNTATVEDVREAYWLTYELGCRMTTIYRDGSRVKQVLEVKKDKSYYDQLTGKKVSQEGSELPVMPDGESLPSKRPTPQEAWGMRVRKKADVGYVYTSVFRDSDGSPVEVFINIGKTGGYIAGAAEVTGRLASRALKYGASLEEIASDLVGIACGTPYGFGVNSVLSAFDAVGKSLIEIAKAKQLTLPIIENDETKLEAIITPKQETQETSNGHTNGYSNGHTNGNGHTQTASSGSAGGLPKGNGIITSNSVRQGQSFQLNLSSSGLSGAAGLSASHTDQHQAVETKFNSCPDCGGPLVYAEGCRKCINITCGWSKCS